MDTADPKTKAASFWLTADLVSHPVAKKRDKGGATAKG
jgi:hypothetical protein